MMFLASYWTANPISDNNNGRVSELFTSWPCFNERTFNPKSEPIILMNFELSNGSYKEKKNKLRDMAIDFINIQSELYGLTYREYHMISDWFEKNGEKYGLLGEFRENGIC